MATPKRRILAKKQFKIKHKEIEVEKKPINKEDEKAFYDMIEKQKRIINNGNEQNS